MLRLALVVTASVLVAACGSETSDTPEPPPARLSQAFQGNCAACHGAEGHGLGAAPCLPGGIDLARFKARARTGKASGMPAFTPTQISDADLESDYRALLSTPHVH